MQLTQLKPGRLWGATCRAALASPSHHALTPAGTRVCTRMCTCGRTRAPGTRTEGWGPWRAEAQPPGDGDGVSCFSSAQVFLSDSELPCQVL